MGAMPGLGALGWGQQGQRGGGAPVPSPPGCSPITGMSPPCPPPLPIPGFPSPVRGHAHLPVPKNPPGGHTGTSPSPNPNPPHHRAPLTVGQVLLEEHGRVRRQLQRPHKAFPQAPAPLRAPWPCTLHGAAARGPAYLGPAEAGRRSCHLHHTLGDVWGGFYGVGKGGRTGGTWGTRVAAPRLCPFGVPQWWWHRDDEATSPGVVSPQLLLSPILGSVALPHVPLMSLL